MLGLCPEQFEHGIRHVGGIGAEEVGWADEDVVDDLVTPHRKGTHELEAGGALRHGTGRVGLRSGAAEG